MTPAEWAVITALTWGIGMSLYAGYLDHRYDVIRIQRDVALEELATERVRKENLKAALEDEQDDHQNTKRWMVLLSQSS